MTRSTKLSDIQLILLSTACQRADGSLLPPPESLGDQTDRIRKGVAALIKRSLAKEIDIDDAGRSWRSEGERQIGVVITDLGRALVGDEAPTVISAADVAANAGQSIAAPIVLAVTEASPAAEPEFNVRAGSKQALVVELMRRDAGASITELAEATGWLPHTTRAALTGLRKRSLNIVAEKVQGITRYSVAASGAN